MASATHEQSKQTVTVLGGGSWGTALAQLLAESGNSVVIWDRNFDLVAEINHSHTNRRYLPDLTLSHSIRSVQSMQEAASEQVAAIVIAIPSHAIRLVSTELSQSLLSPTLIVSAAKGLEAETGLTMTETIASILPTQLVAGIVALSGPNLAREVVRNIPTVCISASSDNESAKKAQSLFMTRSFRVYTHNDVLGVELAGALKNVLAIGAGVCDGLGYGDNTKAAMMTRGLMEMTQMGVAAGSQAMTFLGIAGVGDLMATAAGKLSRNYRVGLGIAEGKRLSDILLEIGQTAEGVPTSLAAYELARRFRVNTPLFDSIHDVMYSGLPPSSAVTELMNRPPKEELLFA